MSRFTYKGQQTKEISFPLGGIGTGCIGLAGNGLLVDWEILNRPNKESYNGYTNFAVKAENQEEVLDARLLLGDFQGKRMGNYIRNGKLHSGYGFGPERMTLAGMPHFETTEFKGEFPFGEMTFQDKRMPGKVKLLAFNPFIPSDEDNSGIPAAFFEIEIENTHETELDYTVAFSVTNPVPCTTSNNQFSESAHCSSITMCPDGVSPGTVEYGDLTIATDEKNISFQQYWYRGNRSDSLEMFWKEFSQKGKLKNRSYPRDYKLYKGQERNKDTAVIAVHVTLLPAQVRKIRMVLAWNAPNLYNYWNPEQGVKTVWKNYYALLFENSGKTAEYCLENWDRLYKYSWEFKEIMMHSTIPEVAKEAILANISILKTPTCLRLENGAFYGFEGCIADEGCCEGSCSHVWNYAYALPFLYPRLERSMRDLEYTYNVDETGKMSFRLQLPLGRERDGFNSCVDGQMGSIFKVYREWKISGDSEWLAGIWPKVKKTLEYAWSPDNKDIWDRNKTGVIWGRAHHTLDMELFGPNSWLTGFYLLALKSASIMSGFLGYEEDSKEYMEIYRKGKDWVDQHLFRGGYFVQQLDIQDESILEPYLHEKALFGESVREAYWNEESGQIKYQIGEGCIIDQVIAQWHANLAGLGELFDKQKVHSALSSIYRYNYFPKMRDIANLWRNYAMDDESGTIICSWPEGAVKPDNPIPYNSETMAGFEYQAACHMIQEGMESEGLELITGLRERYNGEMRNPWNEIECGSNYARSMASYALLLTYSGFTYDMSSKRMGFFPDENCEEGYYFWSLDGSWGSVAISGNWVCLEVQYGKLELQTLLLPETPKLWNLIVNGRKVPSRRTGDGIERTEGSLLLYEKDILEAQGLTAMER